jgi:S-DNA-T family DNA segregation ATPase FtsK/SpoIIIE
MAYQTRTRDPLLDSTTQAALQRRGRELVGLLLVCVGLAALAAVWSYTPEDPSWITATEDPVQNWMGRVGAAVAAPLFMVIGWGALGIGGMILAWGVRFLSHRGQDRAIGRLIFAPIAVALLSIYASTLVPGAGWPHSFGLGGLFGDTALSIALTVVPVGPLLGVKLLSALIAVLTLGLVLFATGFTREELTVIGRFLWFGLVTAYALALGLMARAAQVTLSGIDAGRDTLAARAEARAQRAARMPEATGGRPASVVRARRPAAEPVQPDIPGDDLIEEAPRAGLLGRMPTLLKRTQTAQDDPDLPVDQADEDAPDDRVRSKIMGAIKARVRAPLTATGSSAAVAAAAARRKREPLIADTGRPSLLKGEPPLTKAHRQARGGDPAVMARVAAPDFGPDAEDDFPDTMPAPELVDGPPPASALGGMTLRSAGALPDPAPVRAVVQNTAPPRPQPSRRAMAEAQPQLAFDPSETDTYEVPPLGLLTSPETIARHHLSDEALEANARMLENVLDDYGVKGEIVSVRPGPVVTMYELEPAPGLKASRVIGLADDIARSMSALSARVSTVPGRSVIGIELPNEKREMVVLREMLASRDFGDGNQRLPLALGKDIGGEPVIANLAKMPHLLIAGTTGSGKSVAINTMILSLLYKLSPEECRLIMIDPKMLELSVYDGIPHLLSPVVTDPKKAVVALKWTVAEMEDRYRKMSKMGVRNIEGYNGRVRDALSRGETFSRTVQTGFDDETGDPIFETEEIIPETMPYIVVIVDEMADLMMVAGKEIEACIQRLAQMARASGIHIIMATQRPSVDVITGTIKANFPTRISFQVTSKVDSRTILGEQGAEQLLGQGDMLYMAGGAKITRVHGPFVSDEEVEEIVNHLKQFGPPDYKSGVIEGPDEGTESDIDAVLGLGGGGGNADVENALYDTAVHIVAKDRKCSTSYIQRKLAIGYNKAARLVEQMEEEGVVSPANHVGKREVLVPEV